MEMVGTSVDMMSFAFMVQTSQDGVVVGDARKFLFRGVTAGYLT
jgi:hypothetical protein